MHSTVKRLDAMEEQVIHAVMKRDKGLCRECGDDATDAVLVPLEEWGRLPASMYAATCDTCKPVMIARHEAAAKRRAGVE